jgi:hypothetical protein
VTAANVNRAEEFYGLHYLAKKIQIRANSPQAYAEHPNHEAKPP